MFAGARGGGIQAQVGKYYTVHGGGWQEAQEQRWYVACREGDQRHNQKSN